MILTALHHHLLASIGQYRYDPPNDQYVDLTGLPLVLVHQDALDELIGGKFLNNPSWGRGATSVALELTATGEQAVEVPA